MRGLVLVVLLGLALVAPPAAAQVELDGSLGSTSGLVPGGLLPDGTSASYLIEESYGRRSGPNLFHSFSRFSIPNARSAAFTGDPSIERVIGRVTGGSISQIDGALRNTIDGADLYLLNPRGFFFSGTASLDLRGSLYLSSADTLRFEGQGEFSSVPSSGEVLSFAAPSAWGFTASSAPATIRFNQARNLGVPQGETLEVVGGPVIVSGLSPTTTLLAPGGTIALAARATQGEVPIDVAELSARAAASAELGTVSIGTNAVLDVSDPSDLATRRGRIVIRAGALSVDSSALRVDSAADAAGDTADIDLETTRSIVLRRSNALLRSSSLETAARGNARGGGVRLSSEAVTLTGASAAATTASGGALAGPLEVDAGTLQVSEISRFATSATGDATAGRISLNARTVGLEVGAQISSLNGASTEAPEIAITAEELLQIESGASVATQSVAAGRGAPVRIDALTFEQGTGGKIETGTTGAGAGGDVEIHAASVALRGAPQGADPGGVFASSSGSRAAGAILVTADDLVVEGGAQLSATAQGIGDGGSVEIRAAHEVLLTGSSAAGPSGIFARSGLDPGTTATGDGGSILVVAPVVNVADGAEISAQTFGAGKAGGIQIRAADAVAIAGGTTSRSAINAKAASGPGGDIVIETAELRVDDGGEISASTLDSGDSGDIDIEAQRVYVGGGAASEAGRAGIFAQSIPSADTGIDGGDGGDIEIRAASLVEVTGGGLISVKTRGTGDAGSILVEAPVVIVADGAEISAQTASPDTGTVSGKGGDIGIRAANRLELRSSGAISVKTSGTGAAGEITIRGAENVSIEDGEISARSDGSGRAGAVTLDGVGNLFVSQGGSITTETLFNGLGGSITIDAHRQILIANGGEISARSEGTGDAGSIVIDAGQRFSVRNGGQVTTSATAADGGDITIGASRLIYVQNGRITTDVRAGLGSGGNISLDPEFVVLDHADVIASAIGDGGNISIQTDHYVRDSASVVDASSELGIAGEIQITSPAVDLSSELAQLETDFLDASSKLAPACAARAGESGTFAVRGRARPASPEAPLGAPDEAERPDGCSEPKP